MDLSTQSILIILIVGLVAGWLAGQIVRGGGMGIIADLAVGIVGAFIGSWLLPKIGLVLGTSLLAAIINATIGAVILLLVIRLVQGGGRLRRR
ncbi:MAG: GlsB/YeaQ/YmgE family stress response membrane protein [Devosia sp.]